VSNQRYRFEVHNPIELDQFRAELESQKFDENDHSSPCVREVSS